ncbi:MAG: hypothetical protein ACTS85_02175 [Arsenophonus sp. NC-PG7-MAG3]
MAKDIPLNAAPTLLSTQNSIGIKLLYKGMAAPKINGKLVGWLTYQRFAILLINPLMFYL